MYGIVSNHPFYNGNKRTGLVAMLVHLDRNKLSLFGTSQKELFDLVLAVARHEVFYSDGKLYFCNGCKKDADREVAGIAFWLKSRAKKLESGDKFITYRELFTILRRFGFEPENPKDNSIEIIRYSPGERSIFSKSQRRNRTHIATVSYPGESRQVAMKDVKRIRRICKLQEIDGCDYLSFYEESVVIDSFINQYRTILRRLANR
jgi:death-on-curing protein